jgi:iron complex outermembrane receptor protein
MVRYFLKLSLFVTVSFSILAHAEDYDVPSVIVEGSYLRPGEFGVAPDSTAIKDAASLLKRVPGANINRNGPLTGLASYRGLFGSRVNAVVDGMSWKEVGPNSMDPPLSHIPAALTESLTVYRGISPISSGIETVGGTMKMESRKSKFTVSEEFEFHGVASAGFSEADNGATSSVFGQVSNKNHRFHLSGSLEQGDDYEFDGSKKVTPSQYDRDAYTTGYGYKRGAHELGVNYSNNDTGHTGTPSLPMDIISVRGGIFSADYKVQLAQGHSLKTTYYYQDMRHWMNNFQLRPNGAMMSMYRQSLSTVDGGGVSAVYQMPLSEGELSLGIEVDESKHDATITDPTASAFFVDNFKGAQRERYSVFTEWNGELKNKLNIEAGLRYTQVDMDSALVNTSMGMMPVVVLRDAFNSSKLAQTDHNIDFSLIARQAISTELTLEAGFARKTRSPSYQERYIWIPLESTGGLADGRVYVGDVNLDPETAYQFELGLEYAAGGLYVAPRAFYHRINDYIQGQEITGTTANMVRGMMTGGASTAVLQFTNVDAELYGFDIEWGYELTMDLRLEGAVSYVRGRRVSGDHDNLYRIAPLNTRAQLIYEQINWSIATEVEAYAAQNDVAEYNSEQKTAGYGLFHVRGTYQPVKGFDIGLGVENILDRDTISHTAALNRVMGSDIAVGDKVHNIGRNAYITASYSW